MFDVGGEIFLEEGRHGMEREKSLHENRIFIITREMWILILFTLFYIWFCNSFMVELPHLSWFDFFGYIEPLETGTLKAGTLFSAYSEHGMLGYNILFLINVKFFNLSTMFDVYINDTVVFLCGLVILTEYIKSFSHKKAMYYIGIVGICFSICTATQISSGAMETQVRLGCLFIIIVFKETNDFFTQEDVSWLKVFKICFCLLLALNVFGTIYTFSGIPLLFIILIYKAFRQTDQRKKYITVAGMCCVSAVLYLFEYHLFGLKAGAGNESLLKTIVEVLFLHPITLAKAIIGYNGGSLLGSAMYMDRSVNLNVYLGVGIVVTLILLYAIYMFFRNRMYIETYIPILLIGYSFVVVILSFIGRYYKGWDWVLSEWYSVHSKFQIAGVFWIIAYSYRTIVYDVKKYIVAIHAGAIVVLFLFGAFGNYTHLKRMPNVAAYYKEKQSYLFFEREDMPVDESGNTPLLADLDTTMNAIEIMKKYNLSVYSEPAAKYFCNMLHEKK